MINYTNEPNIGLLKDAIDMHVHVGPDIVERLLNSVELARQGCLVGMRGFLLKSHFIPTAPVAKLTNDLVPDMKMMGTIVLNNNIGGLNPSAVETSFKFDAKLVWMPTMSARNHVEYYSKVGHPLLSIEPIKNTLTILDTKGELVSECVEILDLIKDYDAILATGHLSVNEIKILVDEAHNRGLTKIIITHPLDKMTNMDMETQKQMAKKGAYLEHTLLSTMPIWRVTSPVEIVKVINEIGAKHCIITTDFGQAHHPSPVEGLRFFVRTLLEFGIDEDEIRTMIVDNTHKLLGMPERKEIIET